MLPWPIALLSAFYGVLTAFSGAALWRLAMAGHTDAVGWIGLTFVASVCAMTGLALMRPWARALAVIASMVMLGYALSFGAVCILTGQPGTAFGATIGAGVHLVVIRYLRRPVVKSWFVSSEGEAQ